MSRSWRYILIVAFVLGCVVVTNIGSGDVDIDTEKEIEVDVTVGAEQNIKIDSVRIKKKDDE